jgi:hypothetical protein
MRRRKPNTSSTCRFGSWPRAAAEGVGVLDYLKLYRSEITKHFLEASSAGDKHAVTNLGRVGLEANREIAKVSGEYLNTGAVTNILNVNFSSTPVYAHLHTGLLRKFGDRPAILQEFLEVLDAAEAEAEQPAPVPMIDLTPETANVE